MTPDERRDFLKSRGWSVARTPFADRDQPRWSMTEDPVQSGQPRKSWEVGPWHEMVEEEVRDQDSGVSRNSLNPESSPLPPSPVIAPEFTPDGRPVKRMFPSENLAWFSECVAAGFEIVEPAPRLLVGDTDLGNREGRRNGIGYTLLCRTKSIMGPGCKIYQLSDFTGSNPPQQNVQQTAPKIAKPVPRPVTVFYEPKAPTEHSGANKQKGLFV